MKIGIASKRQPFARREESPSHLPGTIPGTPEGRDIFTGWGPKV